MKWVLVVVGCLVVLVLLVVVIGALLPKAHVATRSTVIEQPPRSVFERITRFEEMPTWRKDVKSIEMLPPRDGKTAFRETSSHGVITYVVDRQRAPDDPAGDAPNLVTRIDDDDLPFGGSWSYVLSPEGKGTRLTITEHGEVKNPVFRFMSRFVFGHTATMDAYLSALAGDKGYRP